MPRLRNHSRWVQSGSVCSVEPKMLEERLHRTTAVMESFVEEDENE
jgi:hypothetical protein